MPKPSTVCVDANLVFRRVAEPDAAVIQNLWRQWSATGRTCAAPRLMRYEVTNALHRAHQHGFLTAPAAAAALRLVLDMPIRLHDEAPLHERAFELADQFTLPAAYNAHYLALAEHLNAEFWTTDRRLTSKVQASLPWVHLVEA